MIGMLTLFKWCKHQYFHVASGRVGGQHGGRLDCFLFLFFLHSALGRLLAKRPG